MFYSLLKNLTSTVVSKTGGKIGSSKSSSSKSKAAAAAPNLIDFDDFGSSEAPEASTSQQASSSAGSGLDALAGLTLGGESTSQPPPSSSNNDLFSLDMSSTSGTSSTAPTPTFSWGSPSLATDPSAGGGISLPSRPGSVNSSSLSAPLSPPALVGSAAQPNYHSPAQSSPSTPSVQQAGQTQQTYTQAQTAAKPDPFEDLLS